MHSVIVYMEIVSIIDAETFLLYIPSKYKFVAQSAKNVYKIKYVDINESELIKQYETADIITFVSTYEGFGMPIIEANAIGRCVITSNCTSMPEIANNAACLVDPFSIDSIKEGVLKICNNQIYRQNLIENGIINVKKFDKNKIHNQYLTLYKKLNY